MKKSLIALLVLTVAACSVSEPKSPFSTDGNATENFKRMEKDFIPGANRTIWEHERDTTGAPKGTASAQRLYTYSDNKFLGNANVSINPPVANDDAATTVSTYYSVAPLEDAPVAIEGYAITRQDYSQGGGAITVTLDKGYKIYTTDESRTEGGSASGSRANSALSYSLIWIDGDKALEFGYADVNTTAKTIQLQDSTPTEYKKVK